MIRKRQELAPGPAGRADRHRSACALPGPERLVGLGFRYWMLGRKSGEIRCWEKAWTLYSGMFGTIGARAAVGSLSTWVGVLGMTTRRDIEVCPEGCSRFCRDECVAISMIAACQHHTCPAMRACAFALIESSMIDAVVDQAQDFADTMAGLDQMLSPASIVAAPALVDPANRLPS